MDTNLKNNALRLDWCSHEAAKFAVMRWHYSKTMPAAMKRIGVWEGDRFVGAVLYGHGSGKSTDGTKYGFSRTGDVAELVRVALAPNRHHSTSKVVSISIKMIAKSDPGLKMLISFADYAGQQHIGTIYQASNWIFIGSFVGVGGYVINGKPTHLRTVCARYPSSTISYIHKHVDKNAKPIDSIKHRYAYPLCKEAREVLKGMAQPYPKLQAQEV